MLYAQEGQRKLEIGELWQTDEDIPSGGWQIGFNWPGNVWREKLEGRIKETYIFNGSARMSGLSCGLKNWKNRRGALYPHVVYSVSESIIEHTGNQIGGDPIYIKVIMKRKPPVVTVNGEENPARHLYDEIDPNLVSDAKMEIRWGTPIGITFQQDYYAFASKNADSYLIVDFHALNNGNTDNKEHDTPELNNQILHDVYFNYGIQPMVGGQGTEQRYTIHENATDDWVEYYGEDYLDYIGSGSPNNPMGDPNADSLRIFMVWDGDDHRDSFGIGDDTGDPNLNIHFSPPHPVLGTFLSPQYFGMGFLHADKSATDATNDLSQPVTTVWYPATIPENNWTPQQSYEFFFEGKGSVIGEDWTGHRPSPQELGFEDPSNPAEVARPNPYITIGPYDEIPFNEDVHWTMLVAVNGLSAEKCAYYGQKWWEYQHGGEGITDEEKNDILASGRDSLMRVYSQANRRYFNNLDAGRDPFDTPDAPPAPDLNVTAGPKSVYLEWSDVSDVPDYDTGINDFAGYRVYRTKEINYNTYEMIWECGGNTGIPVQTSYIDSSVQRGFAYFYYVTSYDDGSQNWEEPGVSLESGKYWNMMQRHTPVYPFLPPENAEIQLGIENQTLKIKRFNAMGSVDTVGIYQNFDLDIDDNTVLTYDLKVSEANIPLADPGYPAYCDLYLQLANDSLALLRFAYETRTGTNKESDYFIQVVNDTLTLNEWQNGEVINIREHFPTAKKLLKLFIGGSGWEFESWFDNISLENSSGTVFTDDFSDGDFTSNPAWNAVRKPNQKPNLDNIVVAPNPWYDKAVKNNYGGKETNKINFFNIPGQCTLRIYTVAGDLVKTIEHSDGTSEQAWYQLNDNNQLVFTGVYIFHVESKFGSKIGKFVIIRSSTKSERDMGFYK